MRYSVSNASNPMNIEEKCLVLKSVICENSETTDDKRNYIGNSVKAGSIRLSYNVAHYLSTLCNFFVHQSAQQITLFESNRRSKYDNEPELYRNKNYNNKFKIRQT